jgi:hypothetical protein
MSTVTELIKVVQSKVNQDEEGQFERGSEEHQYATRFVELFFTEYDTIVRNVESEEFPLMIAGVVNALRDLQVRDYMLGIVPQIKNSIDILEFLIDAAPEYADPSRALVATVYYENDRTEDAINTINEADDNYPLASLLKRVYSAGWPKESFQQMREELHPKVVEGIFGDKE